MTAINNICPGKIGPDRMIVPKPVIWKLCRIKHARMYQVHTFAPPFLLVSFSFLQHWHLEISHEKNYQRRDRWQYKWNRTTQETTHFRGGRTHVEQCCQSEELCDDVQIQIRDEPSESSLAGLRKDWFFPHRRTHICQHGFCIFFWAILVSLRGIEISALV